MILDNETGWYLEADIGNVAFTGSYIKTSSRSHNDCDSQSKSPTFKILGPFNEPPIYLEAFFLLCAYEQYSKSK